MTTGPSTRVVADDYYAATPGYGPGDKALLGSHMRPGTVLDVGAGAGSVARSLREHDLDVTSIDVQPRPGVDAVEAWADDCADRLGGRKFDNILLCSILHEVYSFGDSRGRKGIAGVLTTLDHLADQLRPGGRIVTRDGVDASFAAPITSRVSLPGHWHDMAQVFVTRSVTSPRCPTPDPTTATLPHNPRRSS